MHSRAGGNDSRMFFSAPLVLLIAVLIALQMSQFYSVLKNLRPNDLRLMTWFSIFWL
jgi:hypothetical protein